MNEGFFPGMIVGFVVTAGVCCVLGLLIMGEIGDNWRKQVANHGAAHFYIDANNDRQWDWIPCGPTVEVK